MFGFFFLPLFKKSPVAIDPSQGEIKNTFGLSFHSLLQAANPTTIFSRSVVQNKML